MAAKKRVDSEDVSAFGVRAEVLRASLEIILLVLGKPASVYGLHYEDAHVEIRRNGQSGGYELIRKQNRNPVAIYAATGTCVRLNGEYTYVKAHVLLLAKQALDKVVTAKF